MYDQETLQARRAKLSTEKQALLEMRLRGEVKTKESYTIPPRPDSGPAPLSPLQERLWFLFEWDPESPAYNEAQVFRYKGQFDVRALQDAYTKIIQRHEILRTTYQYTEEQPVQVIAPTINWFVPFVDLGRLPLAIQEVEAHRLAREEANRPFNLRKDYSLRVVLLKLSGNEILCFVTQHHISCDGWSIAVRHKELETLYQAFVAGKPPTLPELPIQYADFACWQRNQLQGPEADKLLLYWKEQLTDLTPMQLPTDRPRLSAQTSKGATLHTTLPNAINEAFAKLCQHEKVTSFMLGLAAFNALLHRYTSLKDIVVGSSIANRELPELENLIGVLIETIILRTDLSGDPTFRELLYRVRQVTLEAQAHKGLPPGHVLNELQGNRDPNHIFLVQVFFEWQDWQFLHPSQNKDSNLEVEVVEGYRLPTDTAKFDLSLYAERLEIGILCSWEYNTDLFDECTITQLASHFCTLLTGILANPDARISELPLLNESEQQLLSTAWNNTRHVSWPDICVHQMFEQQVEQTPDSIAVVSIDGCLTYSKLNQLANQLACYLQKRGVGPEVLVGIYMERSLEMLITILGVLKAGGAYVPMDTLYPPERLAFMLQDAKISTLLSQTHLITNLPFGNDGLICLDKDWVDIVREPSTNLNMEISGSNLAYVIYTSGSTGKPKGVTVQHLSLTNYTRAAQMAFALKVDDRVLQFASIGFDTAAEEIYPCLTSGAALILRHNDMFGLASTFLKACEEWGITLLDLPTAYWHELMIGLDEASVNYLSAVRLVIIGGERALPERLAQWLTQVKQRIRLLNTYGPTEATIVATMGDLTNFDTYRSGEVPIGHPIPNADIYVLDDYLQMVPIGVMGELYIGGIGLARGYLNQPQLTAQRFIPHPFSHESGARLYRTGDRVRYLPDGTIEFLGRFDRQVKIRGYRIELGEIETQIKQYTAVQDALVIDWEDTPGNLFLAAYVVPEEHNSFNPDELSLFLRQLLPDYMIPSTLICLEGIPLTVSGKIDRHALPKPERTRSVQKELVAPETLSEEMLAEIWSELLHINQVSIYDNFFELGGHSILAIHLMARVQDAFQMELPLPTFFKKPTIAELALVIDEIFLAEVEDLSEEEAQQLLEGEE